MRVFLAGATGAIGRPLLRQLIDRGHQVTATTRSAEKAEQLGSVGAIPVVLDGLDGAAVAKAVAQARPDAVVHQMTALAGRPDLKHFDRWFAATNALRTMGTDNLLAAAGAAGVECLVAQSFTGWNNIREGEPVKTEDDPSDPRPAKAQVESLAALRHLEHAVTEAPLRGIVLRFGAFYGSGASEDMIELVRKRMFPILGSGAGVWSWIHVDDAAAATVAALEHGRRGIYNIADDEPAKVSDWLPYFADAVGAPRPLRLPAWLGRILAGQAAVQWMNEGRGASNAKARRELGLQLKFPTWREGFRCGLPGSAPMAEKRLNAAA
ncbi:NAD(P)-dependent oxidoreductase [Mesorhizobium sp. BAC0120]|uniref:NAD-dependent epimerase/dehydratase family protein n=1 Tax=Mesorhizobium sp. BAC0120 TaxID=3090670 RepID=UPI00298D1A05|nr:NAD(P)-dependent oxidoreductase [Mesorhizobium sp. BAC0120]MDW6022426.1 NAD(P)-dependent oxidoreductase [Mesorhizobium sp. BAC0120]